MILVRLLTVVGACFLRIIKNIYSKIQKRQRSKITRRLLNQIYYQTNSMGISRSERNRLNIDTDDFIYGEIEFSSFSNILDRVQPRSNEIFYDLGCGAGKAVLSAAMNFDLSKIVGIELLPGLCQLANEKIQYARSLVGNDHFYLKKLSNIKIINDNLNHCDISESDIVFVNATCFGYTAWKKIQEKFLSLKIGSRVIVTTQSIDDDRFLYLSQRFELMSWGINSVNTYKKIK